MQSIIVARTTSHRRTSSSSARAPGSSRAPELVALLALLAIAACGGAADDTSSTDEDLTHSIAAQSLQHGTAKVKTTVNFTFTGKAGEEVQPDVWATAGAPNALIPTLQLFGPPDSSGVRPLIATGNSANSDPTHLFIGVNLPKTGVYLISVGAQILHEGRFSLRMWSSGSRAPRAEAMQISLLQLPTASVLDVIESHYTGGTRAGAAWSSDEVDALVDTIRAETDPIAALSDCALLYSTLETAHLNGIATDTLVEKAEHAGEERIGDAATFAALPSSAQSFALYWLGEVQSAVFKSQPQDSTASDRTDALTAVDARISGLISSWTGAVEETSARRVLALTRNGVTYGYAADWQAIRLDTDGKTQVFSWQSSDFFDGNGNWIGESSQGALEPDDGE